MFFLNRLTIAIIIVLSVNNTLFAGNLISVNFVDNKRGANNGMVTLKISNTTKKNIDVLKWGTPLEKTLSANIFKVKHGKTLSRYIGRFIKRGTPKDNDYITLKAGEKRLVSVPLSDFYDMQKKEYMKLNLTDIFKSKIKKMLSPNH